MFNVLNPVKICWISDIIAVCVLLNGRKQCWYPDKELLRVKMLTSLSTMTRSGIFTTSQHIAMGLKSPAFPESLFGMWAKVALFRIRGKSPTPSIRLYMVVSTTSDISGRFFSISFEISSTHGLFPLLDLAIAPSTSHTSITGHAIPGRQC